MSLGRSRGRFWFVAEGDLVPYRRSRVEQRGALGFATAWLVALGALLIATPEAFIPSCETGHKVQHLTGAESAAHSCEDPEDRRHSSSTPFPLGIIGNERTPGTNYRSSQTLGLEPSEP